MCRRPSGRKKLRSYTGICKYSCGAGTDRTVLLFLQDRQEMYSWLQRQRGGKDALG